jgi:hypothetical protein
MVKAYGQTRKEGTMIARLVTIAGAGMLSLYAATAANAVVIVQEGLVGGSGDVENVLFNDGSLVDNATTVGGITNQSALIIDFTGNETLTTPSSGQARIEDVAGDGFDFIAFEVQSGQGVDGFVKAQFNIIAADDGQATITLDILGDGSQAFNFDLDGNGENKFTAFGDPSHLIERVTISTNVSMLMVDLRQVRIGGFGTENNPPPPPETTPEPLVLWLLGSGLLGLVLLRRRLG